VSGELPSTSWWAQVSPRALAALHAAFLLDCTSPLPAIPPSKVWHRLATKLGAPLPWLTPCRRAKQHLPFLQRAGRMQGVCEYVLSAHKLKIFVPKEGVTFAFSPSGVRCPQRAQPATGGKPAVEVRRWHTGAALGVAGSACCRGRAAASGSLGGGYLPGRPREGIVSVAATMIGVRRERLNGVPANHPLRAMRDLAAGSFFLHELKGVACSWVLSVQEEPYADEALAFTRDNVLQVRGAATRPFSKVFLYVRRALSLCGFCTGPCSFWLQSSVEGEQIVWRPTRWHVFGGIARRTSSCGHKLSYTFFALPTPRSATWRWRWRPWEFLMNSDDNLFPICAYCASSPQRDVEVEVENVDRAGTFLGTLKVPALKGLSLGVALLEAGLAKLHPSFDSNRVAGGAELTRAQEAARKHKLKVRIYMTKFLAQCGAVCAVCCAA
jgi:hypothetical protein